MATLLYNGTAPQYFKASRVQAQLKAGWTTQPISQKVDIEPEKEVNEVESKVDELEEDIDELEGKIEDLEEKQRAELNKLEMPELRQLAKKHKIKGWHNAGRDLLTQRLIDDDES